MKLLLLILPFTLVACAAVVGSHKDNKSQSYSYQFSQNGCDTGKQSFGSRADMCAGLENDYLNNYCAYSLREDHYEQHCQ